MEKFLKFEHGMKVVVSVVNSISWTSSSPSSILLAEIDAEYGDTLYHTDVWWQSPGSIDTLALRLEIKMFMNKNVKVVVELSDEDEKWLWNLTLL